MNMNQLLAKGSNSLTAAICCKISPEVHKDNMICQVFHQMTICQILYHIMVNNKPISIKRNNETHNWHGYDVITIIHILFFKM